MSWSSTPFSSKNAVYGFCCVALPFDSNDLPPDVERTKERVREYAGGDDGVVREGTFADEIVNRSVTIYKRKRDQY